jgi:hypothetical protein
MISSPRRQSFSELVQIDQPPRSAPSPAVEDHLIRLEMVRQGGTSWTCPRVSGSALACPSGRRHANCCHRVPSALSRCIVRTPSPQEVEVTSSSPSMSVIRQFRLTYRDEFEPSLNHFAIRRSPDPAVCG